VYLGCLTDEIKDEYGPDARCFELVSDGPKSYCLRIDKGGGQVVEKRKVKGVTLMHRNKETTNFDSLKKLVDGEIDVLNVNLAKTIERNSAFQIYTRSGVYKNMRLGYSKRRREGYKTYPWGFDKDVAAVVPRDDIVIDNWLARDYLYCKT